MVVKKTQVKGQGRASVTMPNMLGAKGSRDGTSPDNKPFKACDFIVHPDTFYTCSGDSALWDALVTSVSPRWVQAARLSVAAGTAE